MDRKTIKQLLKRGFLSDVTYTYMATPEDYPGQHREIEQWVSEGKTVYAYEAGITNRIYFPQAKIPLAERIKTAVTWVGSALLIASFFGMIALVIINELSK